ncbi:MAG TPA: glycosyltransferase family 2 protein [Actinobacteria bacterium]|jgi:GT2 family glycosyltransferase|nr:glycosyltransferase family 2 protein [Actinomycetota bacterium]
MENRILIVVVTYNSENFIERCLFSIANQNFKNFTLFVIDNASTDKTVEIVKNYRNAESRIPPSNFRFIKLKKNKGFAGAINFAVFKSLPKRKNIETEFDYILLINPDMVLDDYSIQNLINIFRGNKRNDGYDSHGGRSSNIGAAGGLILEYDSDSVQNLGGYMLPNFVTYHKEQNDNIDIGKIINNDASYLDSLEKINPDYVTGAFFMTPFDLFRSLGGFDSGYRPAYFEELDYCLKVKRLGLKIIAEPSSVTRHFEGASSRKFSKNFYYYYHKNRIRCAVINSSFAGIFKIFFLLEPKWLKTMATRDQAGPLIKAYLINSVFCLLNLFIKAGNSLRLYKIKKLYLSV